MPFIAVRVFGACVVRLVLDPERVERACERGKLTYVAGDEADCPAVLSGVRDTCATWIVEAGGEVSDRFV
jgi:hypothetical protein